MHVNYFKTLITAFTLIIFSFNLATSQNNIPQVDNHVRSQLKKYKLVESDIEDWIVTDNYVSKHNGVNHIYIQQTVDGIPVYGAILNVNVLDNGKILNANSRFVSNIKEKATKTYTITAAKALQVSFQDLKISTPSKLTVKEETKNERQKVVFSKFENIEKDIPVQLVYVENGDGKIVLAWVSEIHSLEPQFDVWSVFIDANTGEFIKKINAVLTCNFGHIDHSCSHEGHHRKEVLTPITQHKTSAVSGDSYMVFDTPVESPNHGSRTLIVDPADPIASPYGWHDTDGVEGAEYTITRGNNVHAQDDINGNNGTGASPDGGASLLFDYTLDLTESPSTNTPEAQNLNSAITNLFYWNNLIHDVFYHFGFDEVSGNFQENNYGNGGIGGDYVYADALDGSDENNARFYTSIDGSNPRMEMYLWAGGGTITSFEVNSPAGIASTYANSSAQFGATSYNVTGDLVIADDGTTNSSEGCNALTNSSEISGNIALIDRGNCEFGTKALNAQNAGAVAVVICNNTSDPIIPMGPGSDGASVTIPTIMISQSDCATIKLNMPMVNVTLLNTTLPDELDGSYDNGIIAHKYGHGISIRLTGGPATNACLTNDEQGGEGWSDFFGLVLTHEAGDTRNTSRGIGTFAIGQTPAGNGIRTYPYTTDMSINPFTYNDIAGQSIPHGVGSVLCTMLWDLYWDMIDVYGYNPDLTVSSSGNAIALQLVIDGLKLQPCNPGFTDVRDAILLADEINNGGVNKCLIWNTFARRGLGFSADQGNSDNVTDGTEGYDMPEGLLIDKETMISETYEGEVFTFRSEATCDCTSKSGVQYKHTIPAGLSIVSVTEGTLQGNEVISDITNLDPLETVAIEYTARVDLCNPSTLVELLEDDIEGVDMFTSSTIANSGSWVKSSSEFSSSTHSWYAQDYNVSSDYGLTMNNGVTINGPTTLSFYHRYQTEENWDGGVVEISTNNGVSWQLLDEEFIQNGYPSAFSGLNSHSLSGLPSFMGSSDAQFSASGFIESIIDLTAFDGETILIRFRFASDSNTNAGGINGWYIDDIKIHQIPVIDIQANVISSDGNEDDHDFRLQIIDLEQEVIYVDKTATGKMSGSDWSNAFVSLQDALALADCNEAVTEIWVSSATYYPTESADPSVSFVIPEEVSIYGGFTGIESSKDERNPISNPTILSADIGTVEINTDNSTHLVTCSNIGSLSIIDGFTIQNGYASTGAGAGIIISNAKINISNSKIINHYSQGPGGAVSIGLNSEVNFTDCNFEGNDSESGNGRAIYIDGTSEVILEDCTLIDANVEMTGGSTIQNTDDSTITSKGMVEIKKSN